MSSTLALRLSDVPDPVRVRLGVPAFEVGRELRLGVGPRLVLAAEVEALPPPLSEGGLDGRRLSTRGGTATVATEAPGSSEF